VSTFLKGKIESGSTKIRWFVERKVARRQNNLFQNNQKQLYKELGGGANGNTNEVPYTTVSGCSGKGCSDAELPSFQQTTGS
jgi:hypothetical protein